MRYIDIYNKIENPLDRPQFFDELLQAYAKNGSFYTDLIGINSKNKKRQYNPTEADKLHAWLFNQWKKEMLDRASRNQIQDIKTNKLISFLKTLPDVKTQKEAAEILNKNFIDSDLNDAMDQNRWDTYGYMTGWTHINCRYVHARKTPFPKIEHRLYINIEQTELHEMSNLFLKKCEQARLPYYFKISESEVRDDSLVIYSDTKNLPKYLEILEQIGKERPDLISKCGKPTILSGTINGWIGYGSEPLEKHESFNSKRADIIEAAIKKEMLNWYRKNMPRGVNYEGKTIDFYEYFAKKLTENEIKNARRILKLKNGHRLIPYRQEQLDNHAFAANLEKSIHSQIKPLLDGYIMGKEEPNRIEIAINGQKRRISRYDLDCKMRELVPLMPKYDPDFIPKLKTEIMNESAKQGIDTQKYCFDLPNEKKLLEAEQAAQYQQRQSRAQQGPLRAQQSQARPQQGQHTTYVYKPMTNEEIRLSQQKIQRIKDTPSQNYRTTTPPRYVYKPMTAKDILASQEKLASVPVAKGPKK